MYQLHRFGSWSVNSGVVHLYVKKIIEQYSDSAGLITPARYMSLKLQMPIRERCGLMISAYSMLRTTGFFTDNTYYHFLKTAVLKKVMSIAQLYMYFSVHFDS